MTAFPPPELKVVEKSSAGSFDLHPFVKKIDEVAVMRKSLNEQFIFVASFICLFLRRGSLASIIEALCPKVECEIMD